MTIVPRSTLSEAVKYAPVLAIAVTIGLALAKLPSNGHASMTTGFFLNCGNQANYPPWFTGSSNG